jgi:hypothetical protein
MGVLIVSEGPEFSQFYPGGEPPLFYFHGRVQEIQRLAADLSIPESDRAGLLRLCLIGLAAHFEAFCKAHFAAVINIHPSVLKGFAKSRQECAITIKELLQVLPNINYRIGSLLSEQSDFKWSSAKTINGLFRDLLGVTPFSKEEAKRFAEFVNDRNLLVHHGGIFTLKYERRRFVETKRQDGISSNVLRVENTDIDKWSKFLVDIAQKLASSSVKAMQAETKGLKLENSREIAVNLLTVT